MNTNSNVIKMISAQERNKEKSKEKTQASLSENVKYSLQNYIAELDGELPANLYELVLQQVEKPLLETVMQHLEGNQSKAAQCLGLNRGTLRKKLLAYDLMD